MSTLTHKKWKSASLKLTFLTSTLARLTNLYSIEPKQGHATGLMRVVCEEADALGVTIFLEAKQYGRTDGLSNDQLMAFYSKFGFKSTPGGSNQTRMKRVPSQ